MDDATAPNVGGISDEEWKTVRAAWKEHPEFGGLPAIECLEYLNETKGGIAMAVEQWKRRSGWYRARQAARDAFFRRAESERVRIVDELSEKRATLVRQSADVASPDGDLAGGRLLLTEPLMSVTDGASEEQSRGFIDIVDQPPWDTWITYLPGRGNSSRSLLEALVRR